MQPAARPAEDHAPSRFREHPHRPRSSLKKKPDYYFAGRLFGFCMRLVPYRYRFNLAVRLAGILAIPLRRTAVVGGLRAYLRVNSERDLCVHLLLRCMTASGTAFDLPLNLEGEEILDAALASGRGTVIVAPHALLSLLILRYLHDRGHTPTVIAGHATMPLAGTRAEIQTVPPTATVLVVARSRLRQGGIVCAMADRLKSTGKKTHAFDSPVGQLRVSDSIFRLAVRCDAQVLFTAARAEKRGVRLTVAAPRAASAGCAQAIVGDFIGFVQAHVAAVEEVQDAVAPAAPVVPVPGVG